MRRPPVEYVENPTPARRLADLVDMGDHPDGEMIVAPSGRGPHWVAPPNTPGISADWGRLWPFVWHACQDPGRPVDEACAFAMGCADCDAEWERRGCPVDVLPPLPADAPVYRQVVGNVAN